MEHEPKRTNVMIVKVGNLAESQARTYNMVYGDAFHFKASSSESEALAAHLAGEIDIIVCGVLGIDWEYIVKMAGKEDVIVYSASDEVSAADFEAEGITFVAVKYGSEDFINALREKAAKRA